MPFFTNIHTIANMTLILYHSSTNKKLTLSDVHFKHSIVNIALFCKEIIVRMKATAELLCVSKRVFHERICDFERIIRVIQ